MGTLAWWCTCHVRNNKAETTVKCFQKATKEFGVPSRVRSDKGGENQLVCYFMVSHRGPGRGSHIAGSSVHNQRIERLWRDVCAQLFMRCFTLWRHRRC